MNVKIFEHLIFSLPKKKIQKKISKNFNISEDFKAPKVQYHGNRVQSEHAERRLFLPVRCPGGM